MKQFYEILLDMIFVEFIYIYYKSKILGCLKRAHVIILKIKWL
jgi:hypothetical protein